MNRRPDPTETMATMEATLASAREASARAVMMRAFGDDLATARDTRSALEYLRALQGIAGNLADDLAEALADRAKVPA